MTRGAIWSSGAATPYTLTATLVHRLLSLHIAHCSFAFNTDIPTVNTIMGAFAYTFNLLRFSHARMRAVAPFHTSHGCGQHRLRCSCSTAQLRSPKAWQTRWQSPCGSPPRCQRRRRRTLVHDAKLSGVSVRQAVHSVCGEAMACRGVVSCVGMWMGGCGKRD